MTAIPFRRLRAALHWVAAYWIAATSLVLFVGVRNWLASGFFSPWETLLAPIGAPVMLPALLVIVTSAAFERLVPLWKPLLGWSVLILLTLAVRVALRRILGESPA